MSPLAHVIGIDVHSSRDCPYVVLDNSARMVDSGWLSREGTADQIETLCQRYPLLVVGIDSPRQPLPQPREWYWKAGDWQPRRHERGTGRHCEVVIKAHNLANPQWTPLAGHAPEWMQLGFRLFERFANRLHCTVFEVFPSASYQLLQQAPDVTVTLNFEHFIPGPRDMLDAAVAAVTVKEFISGRGCEVGGGDGLGTIILPRPLPNPRQGVLRYPSPKN